LSTVVANAMWRGQQQMPRECPDDVLQQISQHGEWFAIARGQPRR